MLSGIIFVAFLQAVTTLAAPTATTDSLSLARDASQGGIWPGEVSVARSYRRSNQLSNGERMKRGLNIAKPERLYGQPRDLSKRLDPHPSLASGGGFTYRFMDCYSGNAGSESNNPLTATSNTDAVNQCAQLANTGGTNYGDFAVQTYQGGGANSFTHSCLISPTMANQQACDNINFAYYQIPA